MRTTTRQEVIEGRLAEIADYLKYHEAELVALYAERLRLWQEGQSLDPKMTQAALAEPSGVTEGAVTQALRKERLKEPERR